MMKVPHLAALSALLVCLLGCHTAEPLKTPSGRPEVTIQGKSAKQILDTARDFFIQRGYTLKPSDNTYKLTFDRRTEKPGGEASKSNCWRVRLALVDLNNGSHHLTGIPLKVEDCGMELESEQTIPVAFPQIQALLEQIKMRLEMVK